MMLGQQANVDPAFAAAFELKFAKACDDDCNDAECGGHSAAPRSQRKRKIEEEDPELEEDSDLLDLPPLTNADSDVESEEDDEVEGSIYTLGDDVQQKSARREDMDQLFG